MNQFKKDIAFACLIFLGMIMGLIITLLQESLMALNTIMATFIFIITLILWEHKK